MDFVDVAAEADVPQERGLRVVVDGRSVALFRVDHGIVAFDDVCPHAGAPLSGGKVRDGHLVCPWHGFLFDVRSGACPIYTGAPSAKVREVRVAGGRVLVAR